MQWSDRAATCRYYLSGSNVTNCYDEVDLSLCFEDTAILYMICAIFWVLAGFSFVCITNNTRPSLKVGILHVAKLVCIIRRNQADKDVQH